MIRKSQLQRPDRLPRWLHWCFWDVDPQQIDLRRHAEYVIARLLEHGDLAAIRWLLRTYSKRQIARVVRQSRQLSRKTANFWRLRLGIAPSQVVALNRRRVLPSDPFW